MADPKAHLPGAAPPRLFRVHCPHPECRRLLALPAAPAGQTFRCPSCQRPFRLSGSATHSRPPAPIEAVPSQPVV